VTDSVTAMLYLNKAGGRVKTLTKITKMIFKTALDRQITISASYINTHDNKIADEASRVFHNPEIELMVNPAWFLEINRQFGPFTLDCFAAMVGLFTRRNPSHISL
jgi:hypothetical protein